MSNNTILSNDEPGATRMKDIVSQLTDVIFILCDAKKLDSFAIISQLTNLTLDECDSIHSLINSK